MRSEKAIQTRLEQLENSYYAHMRTLYGVMYDKGGFADLRASQRFGEMLKAGEQITDEMTRAAEVLGRMSALAWVLGCQETSPDELFQLRNARNGAMPSRGEA